MCTIKNGAAALVALMLAGTVPYFHMAATANGEQVSAIRLAAIERLQSKLGTIRGTIKPDSRNVYLTPKMIEQLKPIRPSTLVATHASGLEEVADLPVLSTGFQLPQFADVDEREIYRMAGLTRNEKWNDQSMITSSTGNFSLPDTADMDVLERAVENMLHDYAREFGPATP